LISMSVTALMRQRRVPETGYGFVPAAREWRIGLLHFLYFVPIGLPLALAGTPSVAQPPVPGLIASDDGTNLRVDAPAGIKSEEETTVSYVATDAGGATATGNLTSRSSRRPRRRTRTRHRSRRKWTHGRRQATSP